MSLRTSDRCHWFAAPRLSGNSLVLLPRCLKIWGIVTPACALVRNDSLFSNSPIFFAMRPHPVFRRRTSPAVVFLNMGRCGKVDKWVFCQPKIFTAVQRAVEIFSQFPKKGRKNQAFPQPDLWKNLWTMWITSVKNRWADCGKKIYVPRTSVRK